MRVCNSACAVAIIALAAFSAHTSHYGTEANSISTMKHSSQQHEPLRSQLIRLQTELGLSLVVADRNELQIVEYAGRRTTRLGAFLRAGSAALGSVNRDGTQVAFALCPEPGFSSPTPFRTECPGGSVYLGVARVDGTRFRKYPSLTWPYGLCWSPDSSKLALSVSERNDSSHAAEGLQIFDLQAEDTQMLVPDLDAHITEQCWSPDGKQIVYSVTNPGVAKIRIYDLVRKVSADLAGHATGTYPSWSPDGQWIGLLEEENPESRAEMIYYLVRKQGGTVKILARGGIYDGPLIWSPDSRFVAYVGSHPGSDERRLWVRRLEDGAEDWFATLSETDIASFQWVQNPDLLKR